LCSAQHQQQAQQCVQGTYCDKWRRCACLDAKTRVLAVGALASATCNNFIADLLVLSEVSHSLLIVAGVPCVHPYLGKWALVRGRGGGMVYIFGCRVVHSPKANPRSANASCAI
jgi:hypothetical protein